MDRIKKELKCDYIFKIIFLGNQGVGKTSIVRRLRDKGFKYKAEYPQVCSLYTHLQTN